MEAVRKSNNDRSTEVKYRNILKLRGVENTSHLPIEKLHKLVLISSGQGGDVFSTISSIAQTLTKSLGSIPEARRSAPEDAKELLKKYGNFKVNSIAVCRRPVEALATSLLNTLSFGKLKESLSKYGYDDLFHLYMVISIVNEKESYYLIIEKNHNVNIQLVTTNDARVQSATSFSKVGDNECIPVTNIVPNTIELKDFIKKGEELQGKNYWIWTPYNNCQVFVYNTLDANGLMNPTLSKFISQCASCLVDGLVKDIAEKSAEIADLASRGFQWVKKKLRGGSNQNIPRRIPKRGGKFYTHPIRNPQF